MENLLDLLFRFEYNLPVINDEALLFENVRAIVERDDWQEEDGTYLRKYAQRELAYVYFMVDNRNFSGYTEEVKGNITKKRVALAPEWEADELVQNCIADFREDVVTTQEKLLASSRALAEDLLETVGSLRANSQRLTRAFATSLNGLTLEEREERAKEADKIKEEVVKFGTMIDAIDKCILRLDRLTTERRQEEVKKASKRISVLETDRERYKPKPRNFPKDNVQQHGGVTGVSNPLREVREDSVSG